MTEDFTKVDENNETADDVSLASVDKNYRPYGLSEGNVYVTGAGLFPTAGSWNRAFHSSITIQASILIWIALATPTIVGFAQDLAKSLVISPKRVPVLTQKQPGKPRVIYGTTTCLLTSHYDSFHHQNFTSPLHHRFQNPG